jgi:hypothetical protein
VKFADREGTLEVATDRKGDLARLPKEIRLGAGRTDVTTGGKA